MDINSILTSIIGNANQRTAGIDAQTVSMAADRGKIQDKVAQYTTAMGAVSEEAANIAGLSAEKEFRDNVALQEIAATFGVNQDEQSYVIANRMADYQAAEEQRKVVRAKYDSLASKNLLDDPLGYIFAQLELPGVVAQNNAFADAKESAAQDIQTRQQLMIQAKQSTTINTADQIKTIRLAEAANKRKKADAELLLATADMDAKIAGMKMQEWQLGDKGLEVQGDLYSKLIQAQQWKMSYDAQQEQRLAMRADRLAKEKEKKDRDESLDGLNTRLALLSKTLGSPITYNVDVVNQIGKSDPKRAQLIMQAAQDVGLGPNPIAVGQLVDAASSSDNLDPGLHRALTELESGIKAKMTTELRTDAGKIAARDPAKFANDVSSDHLRTLTAEASDPKSATNLTSPINDRVFTPYRANHKVNLQDPALVSNRLGAALKLVAETNADVVSRAPNIPVELENQALASLIIQVRNKSIGPDDAALAMMQYYGASAKKNFDMYQYPLLGLPAQTAYVIDIPSGNFMGQPQRANALDYASIKNAVVKAAASGAMPDISLTSGAPLGLMFGLPKVAATMYKN